MEENQVSEQKKPPFLIYAVILVVILAAVVWLILIPDNKEPEPRQPIQPVIQPEPVIEEPEQIEEVVDDVLPQADLAEPEIDNSAEPEFVEPVEVVEEVEPEVTKDDSWVMTQITSLIPNSAVTNLLKQEDIISNFVVFVDNASRGELVAKFSPLQDPGGSFIADEVDGDLLTYKLNESSFSRYDMYAELFASLPVEKSLEIYAGLADEIDQAHMELGYESGTFDRKLKRAIGYLIDTPILTDDVTLVAPSAMFQFAEPELESLLAIQKLLLRMGPENQQKVRGKLVELRDSL